MGYSFINLCDLNTGQLETCAKSVQVNLKPAQKLSNPTPILRKNLTGYINACSKCKHPYF